MGFAGKVAVVTGGGSGIGQACALELAERGATVAVVDRNTNAGRKTVEELRQKGGTAEFFPTDVSLRVQVEGLIREIVSKWGGIDILFNNAAISGFGTVTSTSEEEWDRVLAVNVKGVFLMSKYALPEMIKRGGGAIVNTGSVLSAAGQVGDAAYVASKHAVLGLTRSMAVGYARHNIRVNCVCPGAIDTPMLRNTVSLGKDPEATLEAWNRAHPLGRIGRPEEVARMMVFLASEHASFITGAAVMVDGGLLVPLGGMALQETGTQGQAKT